MSSPLILASTSSIRALMLRNAGLTFTTQPPRVDEEAIKRSLHADNISPRDIADALAEMKAAKVSSRHPGLVLGCDQTLEIDGQMLDKPTSEQDTENQLKWLSGQTHILRSAAVLYDDARPVWRHIGTARLTMHSLSDSFIADYTSRNWHSIQHSVGGYKIEEEGVRLFAKIEGDHFTIQGLPLIPLLSYLADRGTLPI